MNIQTRFDLGQQVYAINFKGSKETRDCPLCGGSGRVDIKGQKFTCPSIPCNLGKITVFLPGEWKVEHHSGVGKIGIEIYQEPSSYKDRYQYMLNATGVGSGQVWKESYLFATNDEALAECERRNSLHCPDCGKVSAYGDHLCADCSRKADEAREQEEFSR